MEYVSGTVGKMKQLLVPKCIRFSNERTSQYLLGANDQQWDVDVDGLHLVGGVAHVPQAVLPLLGAAALPVQELPEPAVQVLLRLPVAQVMH